MIRGLTRFRVVAGPKPGADSHDAEPRLRSALARVGATGIHTSADRGRRYTFEIESESPETAFGIVTRAFRSVYGLEWWAEVAQLGNCGPERTSDLARRARWN
jgi:hypothetical protein